MESKTTSQKIVSAIKRGFLYLGLVIVLLLVITYFVAGYKYSEGTRAGVLLKFSQKGYVFKTYEGELNIGGLGNLPNTAQVNQIWDFSVVDKGFADSLDLYQGKRVSLHYHEVVKNLPWQGDTKYFVDGVKVIE